MSPPTGDRDVKKYPFHPVVHFKQRYHWDCGVSCVLMLLSPEQRDQFLTNFEQICREEGFGQSTWTIDLCYLLKRFNIKHCMYTSNPGVNEDYKNHKYYSKIIDIDRNRIETRFSDAASCGIEVRPQVIGIAALQAHLASGPAILLVDGGALACDLCKHNKLRSQLRLCFGGGYKGHYVLVVGFTGGKFLYRDPALSDRVCAASCVVLQRAAEAAPTDHDAILLHHYAT